MYRRFIKRWLDFVLSFIGIVVLSPVLIVLAALVRIKLGSPVLFRQERPGRDEKIFTLCKFRTMTDKKDGEGELPELFNILKGDMSIIGPRPLLVSYLPYYTEEEKLRHKVRPGLTGLAQVSGRNFIDWDKRMEKDVEYVKNLSFFMDIKVLWMTVMTVLGHSDEVAEDTNAVEGNFAQIRQKRLEETGRQKD